MEKKNIIIIGIIVVVIAVIASVGITTTLLSNNNTENNETFTPEEGVYLSKGSIRDYGQQTGGSSHYYNVHLLIGGLDMKKDYSAKLIFYDENGTELNTQTVKGSTSSLNPGDMEFSGGYGTETPNVDYASFEIMKDGKVIFKDKVKV